MTDRERAIQAVINARRPLADRASEVVEHLGQLASGLVRFRDTRDRIVAELERATGSSDVNAGRAVQELKALAFEPLERMVSERALEIRSMLARLHRKTLNLGVVGYAGQGKSTLLQTLSGLNDTAIPTGDLGHVTGARSVIQHTETSSVTADVWFYMPEEFLREVIWPYFDQESLRLGPKPDSLESFVVCNIDSSKPELSTTDKAYIDKLREYQHELQHYRELLGSPSPKVVTGAEIRKYVAHESLPDKENIREKYHAHRAVKHVQVRCHFPFSDVGSIGLVDLPGLGDHNINDSTLLKRTLGTEVDFVLFLKKPSSDRAYIGIEDTEIYGLARNAIPTVPLENWSMFVLNLDSRSRGNLAQCQECASKVIEKGIKVLDVRIVNCRDREQVGSEILDPALSHLAESITSLDQEYVRASNEALKELASAFFLFRRKCETAISAVLDPADGGDTKLFNKLFEQLWGELKSALQDLVINLSTERETVAIPVSEAFKRAVHSCDGQQLPTNREIASRFKDGPGTAFEYFLNTLRARLVRQFESVDREFHDFMETTKEGVVDILRQQGQLHSVVKQSGSSFLRNLAQQVAASTDPETAEELVRCLNALADAQLSYRGFIQHRVRKCLNRLDPSAVAKERLGALNSIDDIAFLLEKHYSLTVGDIDAAIGSWSHEPNAVAFSLIEEFVDRAIHGESVFRAWQDFYTTQRAHVWRNRFSALASGSRLRADWKLVIAENESQSSRDRLSLIEAGER